MTTIVLDTLDYAAKLNAGGFSEQQAETQARALAEVLENKSPPSPMSPNTKTICAGISKCCAWK